MQRMFSDALGGSQPPSFGRMHGRYHHRVRMPSRRPTEVHPGCDSWPQRQQGLPSKGDAVMITNGANSKAGKMREQLSEFLGRNLSYPRLGWPRRVLRHRHRPQCRDEDRTAGEEQSGMLEHRLVDCRRSSVTAAAQCTTYAAGVIAAVQSRPPTGAKTGANPAPGHSLPCAIVHQKPRNSGRRDQPEDPCIIGESVRTAAHGTAREWIGIEPTRGRANDPSTALKAAGPTRRPDTPLVTCHRR